MRRLPGHNITSPGQDLARWHVLEFDFFVLESYSRVLEFDFFVLESYSRVLERFAFRTAVRTRLFMFVLEYLIEDHFG